MVCKLAQRVACLRKTVKAIVGMCLVRDPTCTATKHPLDTALYKWLSTPDDYAYGAIQIKLSLQILYFL